MLAANAIADIEKFLSQTQARFSSKISIAALMDDVNKAYHRWDSKLEGPECSKRVDKKDIIVPIVKSQVDSTHSFYVSLFLSNDPIFSVVAAPEAISASEQINSVMSRHGELFQWRWNLSKALLDSLKYNMGAVEVTWETRTTFNTSLLAERTQDRQVVQAGNAIKHINLYNAFWDPEVIPAKVHTEGTFAGYAQPVSKMRMIELFKSLPEENLQLSEADFVNTLKKLTKYCTPNATRAIFKFAAGKGSTDYGSIVDGTYTGDSPDAMLSGIVLTTLYAKIIPKQLKMKVDARSTPQIWKFLFVGDKLVYAERQTNAHNYLPIVFAQPTDDGLGCATPSLAESLFDVQTLTTRLINSDLKSTDRILVDRMVYDPARISSKDINSRSVTAKIPLMAQARGTNPGSAFAVLPYSDPSLGLRTQQASQIAGFADSITGQNPISRGQFVKGNKTNEQFQATLTASNDRPLQQALILKDQFFSPIEQILLLNILQYQKAVSIYDRNTGKLVDVNPASFVQTEFSFEIADGLRSASRIINSETFGSFLQLASQSPELQEEFKVGDMILYFLQSQGLRHAERFKRSDAELQQRADQRAQQAAQQAGA